MGPSSLPALAARQRTQTQDPKERIAYYTRALRLRPDFAAAYCNRGWARGNTGDAVGSIDDYTTAIRLDPNNGGAYYNRAEIRRQTGELALAVADYQKYLDLGGAQRDGDRAKVETTIKTRAVSDSL